MIYIVDAERNRTTIHRVDTQLGRYLIPRYIEGDFNSQVQDIISFMYKDEPIQIIFDLVDFGCILADRFKWMVQHPDVMFLLDSNGNVTYDK